MLRPPSYLRCAFPFGLLVLSIYLFFQVGYYNKAYISAPSKPVNNSSNQVLGQQENVKPNNASAQNTDISCQLRHLRKALQLMWTSRQNESSKVKLSEEVINKTYNDLLKTALQADSLASNPQPQSMQIVIATTWRSGSTFLEQLLGSHAGIYNHYEPLLPFGFKVFNDEEAPGAREAQMIIQDLLHCRYSSAYLKAAIKTDIKMITRNGHLWSVCKNNIKDMCFQKDFLEASCALFPWSLIKTVRIGVKLLKPTLEDQSLNTKIIFLVRDPRAIINSRKSSVQWCNSLICSAPSILCSHMEENLKAVKELSKQFPERIHVLRYEDLALHAKETTIKLINKLGLDFDQFMDNFITAHTTRNINLPWSTTRKSAERVLYWTTTLSKNDLNEVQKTCQNVMKKFGYLPILSTKEVDIEDILTDMVL